jgi:hypothetical protein
MKDEEIHKKFQLCGKNVRHWLNECKMMLPEIERRQIYKKKGFEDIYEYARIIAGLSRNQVNESLRILEKLEDKPDLLILAREQGISKVKTLVTIATEENQEQLAKNASKMSTRAVEQWSKDIKAEGLHVKGPTEKNGCSKPNLQKFTLRLSPENLQKMQKWKGEKTWDEFIENFLHFIEEEQDKFEEIEKAREEYFQQTAPPVKEQATRHVPKVIETHMAARSKNICEHPNCKKPAIEKHHVDHFAIHKAHDPNKMWKLCKEHHQLAHHGLIKNENLTPSNWQTTLIPQQTDIDKRVQEYRTPQHLTISSFSLES